MTAGTSAQAATPEAEAETEGEDAEEMRNVFGIRGSYFAAVETRGRGIDAAHGLAASLAYERTLFPRWLVTSLTVPIAVAFDDDLVVKLPIHLRFKKPFQVNERFHPYIAAGLALNVDIEPEDDLWLGGSFGIGTFIWPTRHFGIDIGLDYNLLEVEGPPEHQILFGFGPAFRW